MNKNLLNSVTGILAGLLIAWLLGLFNSAPPTNAEPDVKIADSKVPVSTAASPLIPKTAPTSSVIAPSTPPVKALPSTTAVVGAAAQSVAQVAIPQARQAAQKKAITNNLRQMYVAGQIYMQEKGVTAVGYYDLVGTTTDSYVRTLAPVMGESYESVYMTKTDTEINVVAPDGTTFTFSM